MVKADIDWLIARCFAKTYESWDEAQAKFGNDAVSNMVAIAKLREDGTTKLQLIIDMLWSNVNANVVHLHERIVSPRCTISWRTALPC